MRMGLALLVMAFGCHAIGVRLGANSNADAARAHEPCPVGTTLERPDDAVCIDSDGETWTACAWNHCGLDEDCRRRSVAKNH